MALVLKFTNEKPTLMCIKEIIKQSWEIQAEPTVGMMNQRNVLIKMHNEKDFNTALAKDVSAMDICKCRIIKWSPNVERNEESPIVNCWIRLLSLPSLHHHALKVLVTP